MWLLGRSPQHTQWLSFKPKALAKQRLEPCCARLLLGGTLVEVQLIAGAWAVCSRSSCTTVNMHCAFMGIGNCAGIALYIHDCNAIVLGIDNCNAIVPPTVSPAITPTVSNRLLCQFRPAS